MGAFDSRDIQPFFTDREDAGRKLATALTAWRGTDALVLGIPRGGVPVAAEVARELGAELDVVVARKLGAPGHGELAIGAVTANGGLFLNHELIDELGVSNDYLDATIARETAEARRREERFRGERPAPRVEDRWVILVDDGLATGATMHAAAQSVKKRRPRRLVIAVPVGSSQASAELRKAADEVVCLMTPEPFWAVGLYYHQFAPVEDDAVVAVLRQAQSLPARPNPTPASAR